MKLITNPVWLNSEAGKRNSFLPALSLTTILARTQVVEGEVASFLIALLKYPRPILDWSRDRLKWDLRVGGPGGGHWKRRFFWDGGRVVDACFFSECVFLLCYKASDSIGEVSRRAGMRACQLGREPEPASGVRDPGAGDMDQDTGHRGEKTGAGALRAECKFGRGTPQRPPGAIELLSLVRYPIPCSTPVQTPELAKVELPALPWVRSLALPSSISELLHGPITCPPWGLSPLGESAAPAREAGPGRGRGGRCVGEGGREPLARRARSEPRKCPRWGSGHRPPRGPQGEAEGRREVSAQSPDPRAHLGGAGPMRGRQQGPGRGQRRARGAGAAGTRGGRGCGWAPPAASPCPSRQRGCIAERRGSEPPWCSSDSCTNLGNRIKRKGKAGCARSPVLARGEFQLSFGWTFSFWLLVG